MDLRRLMTGNDKNNNNHNRTIIIKTMLQGSKKPWYWLLPICCLSQSACQSVQPWERGNLARPVMQLVPFPAQAAAQGHIHASREAAGAMSSGSEGGGCGCN